jgi:hypothetical protein
MMHADCKESTHPMPSPELEPLAAAVLARLGGRIHNLRLLLREDGLILQGRVGTYYAKQLAQHAVMKVTEYRIQANEIEVV